MTPCRQCRAELDLYLDGELSVTALEAFQSHLAECPSCTAELSERRQFLARVRAARPQHVAPDALRERVIRILGPAEQVAPSSSFPQPGPQVPRTRAAPFSYLAKWRLRPFLALATTGTLGVAAVVILWISSRRDAQAQAFIAVVIQVHEQQMAGQSHLEIETSSSPDLSSWFADKVPFRFRLPVYPADSETAPQYNLVGGRLMRFQGRPAAYVAYRMQSSLISLAMTSSDIAVASGGEVTRSRGLNFHSHREGGLQVVTWSVHHLTYALVSSVTLPAGQSCKVCHSRPEDRDLLRNMNARKSVDLQHEPALLLRSRSIVSYLDQQNNRIAMQ